MLSVEKVIDDKQLFVKYSSLLGSSQLLLIREHWSAKKELKTSVFFLKISYKLISVIQWRNDKYFLLFRKVLSKDQHALELL